MDKMHVRIPEKIQKLASCIIELLAKENLSYQEAEDVFYLAQVNLKKTKITLPYQETTKTEAS